jgi:hypothetical protein
MPNAPKTNIFAVWNVRLGRNNGADEPMSSAVQYWFKGEVVDARPDLVAGWLSQ